MNRSLAESADSASLIHPSPNEYVGRHTVATWRPSPEYGPVPTVPAGFAISLGVEPHITLTDLTGGTVRILLSPEDVEHIVAQANEHTAAREARYERNAS